MQFKDFEVVIASDSGNFQEYNPEVNHNNNQISCWIASEVGRNFSIKCRPIRPQNHELSFKASLDGMPIRGWYYRVGETGLTMIEGVNTSMTTIRPFAFSTLHTTDDDELLDKVPVEHLGEIIVDVWHISLGRQVPVVFDSPQEHQPQVHERSKKAISHSISYGQSQPLLFEPARFQTLMTGIRKISSFIFRYRPLDFLRAEGIAPSPEPVSASPVGSPARKRKERVASSMASSSRAGDGDSNVQNEARLKQLLAKAADPQFRLSRNNPNKRIKAELRPTVISDEVVDLTECTTAKAPNVTRKPMYLGVIDLTDD